MGFPYMWYTFARPSPGNQLSLDGTGIQPSMEFEDQEVPHKVIPSIALAFATQLRGGCDWIRDDKVDWDRKITNIVRNAD